MSTELMLSDVNLMSQIIQIGQAKGAFAPSDMEIIGKLYTKISNILSKFKPEENVPPEEKINTIEEETEEIN